MKPQSSWHFTTHTDRNTISSDSLTFQLFARKGRQEAPLMCVQL